MESPGGWELQGGGRTWAVEWLESPASSSMPGLLTKRTHWMLIGDGSDFDWNEDKNQRLVEQRGISFERVISAIERGGLVDVLEHPNQERYRGQMIYVVDIEQYIYLVPFVTRPDGSRFLKTIIPSRKATRDYRKRRSS